MKSIGRLLDEGQRTHKIVKDVFQVVIRSGDSIRFWTDLKWDSFPLKMAFPRMFALAANKDGVIKDFGSFEGMK